MQRLAFGSVRLHRLSVDLLRGPVCSIADSTCKSAGHRMILTAARSSTLSARLSFITEGHHNLEKHCSTSSQVDNNKSVKQIISVHDNYCSSMTGSLLKAFNFGNHSGLYLNNYFSYLNCTFKAPPLHDCQTACTAKVTVASDSEELREWRRRKRMDRAATPPHFTVSMCPAVDHLTMAAG
uniref:Uncharacterized protein n=1 Tax=Oryza barthii TaxID=65489 RepID=A0A0D3H4K3_9ORYZ